jgi:hypothetical protein
MLRFPDLGVGWDLNAMRGRAASKISAKSAKKVAKTQHSPLI